MNAVVSALLLLGLHLGTTQDSAVRFEPAVLSVVRDSTGYVQHMISLYSTSKDTVRITGVKGSCGCANASVQRPLATDSLPGRIYVAVNAHHFTDSVNYVDYTINHSGSATPAMFRVIVRLPK